MDVGEVVPEKTGEEIKVELVPLQEGLSSLTAENKKVGAVLFLEVLDQEALKDTLDTCRQVIDVSPDTRHFAIYLVGEKEKRFDMFARLWQEYVTNQGLPSPEFNRSGDRGRFLSEAIGSALGFPGRVCIDSLGDYLGIRLISDKIGIYVYSHIRNGDVILLIGEKDSSLKELATCLKRNRNTRMCEIIALLADGQPA